MDPRHVELIHAEVDGENTPAESEELRELLARDPAAREAYEEIRRLGEVISRAHDQDPPPGFRRSVMASLAAMRAVSPRRAMGPALLPSLGALAAGILVGLLLARAGSRVGEPVEPSAVAGTLTSAATARAEGTVPVGDARTEGEIRWTATSSGVAIRWEPRFRDPVAVVVEYDPATLGLAGVVPERGGPVSIEGEDGRVTVRGPAESRWSLRFDRRGAGDRVVSVRIERDGSPAGDARVEIPF